ncbi:MAG: hypothetical protein DRQ59_11310 [Gammaproteobacteria bacterium]|nr:MAG: hypothetical protein DRQ59_11310 [Gammaproteobacteria bacterium]
MKGVEQINHALSAGLARAVFEHARNFLVCAFILAIGLQEMRPDTESILDLISFKYSGIGVVALACFLIILNLLDGIRRIARLKHHRALIAGLIVLYMFMSLRVVEMALTFRAASL